MGSDHTMTFFARFGLALVGVFLWAQGVQAATEPEASTAADEAAQAPSSGDAEPVLDLELHDRMLVLGAADSLLELPGSGHRIGKADLEIQGHSDIHRILRQVPGINIQEEEGYGLRPNIGIRGTGVERSQKITLLEDGVLIAPAPYSAPSAYYSPTAGRMEGFEVRKGSSSIRQGPYTTGGAINYLSTSIPGELGGRVEVAVGEDGMGRSHLVVGDSGERLGWLLEGYRLESDGFKKLDTGGPTGFELDDFLGKLRWNSRAGARMYQAVEIKVGKTRQRGHETYVGLAPEDFRRSPFRRYAGSEEDFITTDHEQLQLSWLAQIRPRLDLTVTAYDNEFFRNWHKLESVGGVKVSSVLKSPDEHARELAVLRGDTDSAPGELAVRNNRRDYFARGLQLVAGVAAGSERRHDLEIGVRYHTDEEDRFQEEDLFQMLGGRVVATAPGAPGSQANRISSADALAVFVTDSFSLGRWHLTPGARYESIDLERRNFGKTDPDRTGVDLEVRRNRVDELIPGLGVSFSASDTTAIFVGIHRGFAPPAPGSAEEVKAEESVNYEAGVRYRSGSVKAEVVGFYNDYDNLLGTDTVSSGGEGTGDQFNGGASRIVGLEVGLGYEVELTRKLSLPLRLSYTLTQGEFRSSFKTTFADWAPAVERGDEIPYIPESQLFLSTGLRGRNWNVTLDSSYTSEIRTNAGQGAIEASDRVGSRFVLDAAADYRLAERYRLFLQVRNLTDKIYVAARRPAGLRPGLPRTVVAGISLEF